MTDNESSLLRAILESPGDDTPRLAYADEIEATQTERAEFIRVQLEWFRLMSWRVPHNGGTSTGGDPAQQRRQRLSELKDHAYALWAINSKEWFNVGGIEAAKIEGQVSQNSYGNVVGVVSRGFVAEIRAPLAVLVGGECTGGCEGTGQWAEWGTSRSCPACHGTGRVPGIGRELFLRQPVTRVEVTDREPWQVAGRLSRWGWSKHPGDIMFPGEAWVIPAEILDKVPEREDSPIRGFRHRRWFPTESAARDALSDALVAHFREQCGLPPLVVQGE